MTGMGTPKPGPSFPHDEIPWPTEPRFIEKRHGWFGWRVYEHGDDGFTRWTYTGKFWRWVNAARVAQALTLAFNAGYRSNDECWQRNRDFAADLKRDDHP